MDEKLMQKKLRRYMGRSGWVLLIYYLLMNVAVTLSLLVDAIGKAIAGQLDLMEDLGESLLGNAWGYILASVIGLLILFLWKKRQFCFIELWKHERPMTACNFLVILVVFLGMQGAFQIFAITLELILNLFGFSALAAIDLASGMPDTFSMFLYVGLVAPIVEEILFRGVLLRMMRPYGKLFAIVTTAFLFGMFHGNPVQTPYAFLSGIVLGYVTVEYSIGWAMVLHMINNLILGDTVTRLSQLLPQGLGDALMIGLIWGCFISGIVLLLRRRREIAAYCADNPIHPWCRKAFFRAPSVILFTVLMALSMLGAITML